MPVGSPPRPVCEARSVHLGIIGGTGPAGRGLASRAAAAGHVVSLGSRDAGRASEIVDALNTRWPDRGLAITGVTNRDAASADLVVLATPWEAAVATLRELSDALDGTVVVSMVNALVKQGREMLPLVPPRGSMAAAVQSALPRSKVAAAFHHLPAADMEDLDASLGADVLVCSDHPEATEATLALTADIIGLRGVDAGSLNQAMAIEAFTAVCITVNIRHRVHSSVRLAGL